MDFEKAYEIGKIAVKGFVSFESLKGDDIEKQQCQELRDLLCDEDRNTVVMFPWFHNIEASWSFIRGCFDVQGHMSDPSKSDVPECFITSRSLHLLNGIAEFCKIPCEVTMDGSLWFRGTNCIDFLGKLYEKPHTRRHMYNWYTQWLSNNGRLPQCHVYKDDSNAVFPKKGKPSDVGYDLTVIKESKKWHNNITLYDTGIKIKVQHGYYAEVVPRSSLSKSGYMLANSIGVIDANYTGNIYIALVKVDPSAPDIELPFRCCQLIFRRQHYLDLIEVDQPFDSTTRDAGGFGSTGTN